MLKSPPIDNLQNGSCINEEHENKHQNNNFWNSDFVYEYFLFESKARV
jgi:hypothetical protein